KYLKLQLSDFLEEVIEHYGQKNKTTPEGFVNVEVRKGMYGLPQAGLLAQELLKKLLNEKGYKQSQYTPGFWMHEMQAIQFTLMVDDFGKKLLDKKMHVT
ncbi:hypothetical protein ACHAW6_007023, partial [Cyclotella cf. meneghiniana]